MDRGRQASADSNTVLATPIGYDPEELGALPESWRLLQLGEFTEVRTGSAFPHEYQGKKAGKYPFFKVSDMTLPGNAVTMRVANHWVDDKVVAALRAKPFPEETIVFPKVGAAVHTNKKRIMGIKGLVDNNVMGVIVQDVSRCCPDFLYWWFVFINISELSNPGPLPSITATAVKNAIAILPPLPEQRAIVHVLRTV